MKTLYVVIKKEMRRGVDLFFETLTDYMSEDKHEYRESLVCLFIRLFYKGMENDVKL